MGEYKIKKCYNFNYWKIKNVHFFVVEMFLRFGSCILYFLLWNTHKKDIFINWFYGYQNIIYQLNLLFLKLVLGTCLT